MLLQTTASGSPPPSRVLFCFILLKSIFSKREKCKLGPLSILYWYQTIKFVTLNLDRFSSSFRPQVFNARFQQTSLFMYTLPQPNPCRSIVLIKCGETRLWNEKKHFRVISRFKTYQQTFPKWVVSPFPATTFDLPLLEMFFDRYTDVKANLIKQIKTCISLRFVLIVVQPKITLNFISN